MEKKLLLTVGNEMMGDDAAGPHLAQRMNQEPIAGWSVLDGGSAPENHLHQIREMQPDCVLIVDAAEMGLAPGEIRTLEEKDVADQFIMTTHNLPLVYVLQLLKEFVPRVEFIGIQPQTVAFAYPMSPPVTQAVDSVYQQLKRQSNSTSWSNRNHSTSGACHSERSEESPAPTWRPLDEARDSSLRSE